MAGAWEQLRGITRSMLPPALPDGDVSSTLMAVWAAEQELAALRLRLIGEAHGRDLPRREGATNTAAWVAGNLHVTPRTAAEMVRLAAALEAVAPATGKALSAGEVTVDQAQAVVDTVRRLPAPVRAEAETHMLGLATEFNPPQLRKLGAHLHDVVDPAGAEQRRRDMFARREKRDAQCGITFSRLDGDPFWTIRGLMNAETATVLRTSIDALCKPRRRPDPTTPAPAADGQVIEDVAPPMADLRTAARQRLDALHEICALAMATGRLPDNGGDRPQVVIHVPWETLRDQTGSATFDDGTEISPADARRFACDCSLLPVVLNGKSVPLDVGRERRFLTGPIRRALDIRDRGCCFPGCDRPREWCDAHHIEHWADGGKTSVINGGLLCRLHHVVVHKGEWLMRINPEDGLPEFIPPPYIDAEQRPRRNAFHRRP